MAELGVEAIDDGFAEYIQDRKVLIADPSAVTRASLFRILQDLGTKSHQISMVSTFTQALDELARFKPHILIAEWHLNDRYAVDLLQTMRENLPLDAKDSIFVVVASDTSQSAVARAAEEDVDAYIVKPYSREMVQKTLIRALMSKARPSEYVQSIERSRAKTREAKYEDAEQLLLQAIGLERAPSLACYYLGQVREISQRRDLARGAYYQGLQFNKIHYKCNLGLYELSIAEKNYEEAYDVIKRMSHYFPNNPKRLSEVLRLAIINSRYDDVEKYYTAFSGMDDREESLIRHVCAALIVCGRYFLRSGTHDRALEMFKKATCRGTGRTRILKEVVQALLDHRLIKEAREYLGRFPVESQGSADYLNSRLAVLDAENELSGLIADGKELISKGLANERTFEIMIRRSSEARLELAVDKLLEAAKRRYPARAEQFEEVARAARAQFSAA